MKLYNAAIDLFNKLNELERNPYHKMSEDSLIIGVPIGLLRRVRDALILSRGKAILIIDPSPGDIIRRKDKPAYRYQVMGVDLKEHTNEPVYILENTLSKKEFRVGNLINYEYN